MLSSFKQLQLIKAEVFMPMPGTGGSSTFWGPSCRSRVKKCLLINNVPAIDANFEYFETEDYRIGYAAFISKTKPKFEGR